MLTAIGDLGESDENVENLCWATAGGDGAVEDDESAHDSILGKLVGSDDESEKQKKKEGESQEPLALLVVHATMHMLFLPQFTCDFVEERQNDDESIGSIGSGNTEKHNKKGSNDSSDMDSEYKKLEASNKKDDYAAKSEIGLGAVKVVENGVLLQPKPASIVWASGCGVKKKEVRENLLMKLPCLKLYVIN